MEHHKKRKLGDGYEYKNCVQVKYIKMIDLQKYLEDGWEVCMENFPLCPDGIGPTNALVKKKCTSES